MSAIGNLGQRIPIRRDFLSHDAIAGVATAAVILPQAMAYAVLAGLPVEVGLYVALVPTLAYAVLGSSRSLSVSTTSTVAVLTVSALAGVGASGSVAAAATLAMLVGAILLAAGLLQLGFLGDLISLPVLTGFKLGTALVIVADQLDEALGLPAGDASNFSEKVWYALVHLPDANLATVALTASSIAVLVVLRRWAPRIPGPLVVVVLGILAVNVLDLAEHGVQLFPAVPSGTPSFDLPELGMVKQLVPAAAGIALMCFVESIATARALVRRRDPSVVAEQELRALGAANLLGGLFSSMPASGGLSQSLVHDKNGARTRLAGAVTALMALVALLFLTPLLDGLAAATLCAVILYAVGSLINVKGIRRIASIRRREGTLAIATTIGILYLGVLYGVLVAVAISVGVLLIGTARQPLRVLTMNPRTGTLHPAKRHPQDAIPGLLIVRSEGPLFFGNFRATGERLVRLIARSSKPPRVLLLDCSSIPDMDMTALEGLPELARRLEEYGVELWLCTLTERPKAMFRRTGYNQRFKHRLFRTPRDAVARFRAAPPPPPAEDVEPPQRPLMVRMRELLDRRGAGDPPAPSPRA